MTTNFDPRKTYLAFAGTGGDKHYAGAYAGPEDACLAAAAKHAGTNENDVSLVPLPELIVYDATSPDKTGHLKGKLLFAQGQEDYGIDVKMFTTATELLRLTGLPDREALWHAGFDMDDWDVGFRLPIVIHLEETDSEGEVHIEPDYNSPYYWLMSRICGHCAGASHTEYGGYHYYMSHHA